MSVYGTSIIIQLVKCDTVLWKFLEHGEVGVQDHFPTTRSCREPRGFRQVEKLPLTLVAIISCVLCSGRHRQEEALFEEMLQISQVLVGLSCPYWTLCVCGGGGGGGGEGGGLLLLLCCPVPVPSYAYCDGKIRQFSLYLLGFWDHVSCLFHSRELRFAGRINPATLRFSFLHSKSPSVYLSACLPANLTCQLSFLLFSVTFDVLSQKPDNIVFVMDASIGQSCDVQVGQWKRRLSAAKILYLCKGFRSCYEDSIIIKDRE